MATKKTNGKPPTGRRTKKIEGYVSQSLRVPVEDNERFHEAAKIADRSFNSWAVVELKRAARKLLDGQP